MVDAETIWQTLLLTTATVILISTIVFFIQFPKTRAHPGPVLVWLILSSCLAMIFRAMTQLSTSLLLSSISTIGLFRQIESNCTVVFFWLTFYFTTATTFWYLMLAMDVISSLSNPFLPFRANALIHHSLAWPLAALWCLIYYGIIHYCQNSISPFQLRILLVLPLYFVLIYIVIALRAAWAKSCQLSIHAHESTRRMAKLIQPYLIVFITTGCIYLIVFIAEAIHGTATVYSIYIDQLTGILSSIVLFVLFYFDSGAGLCRPFRRRTRSRLSTALASSPLGYELHDTQSDPSSHCVLDFDVDVAAELRKMIMSHTRMGIVSAERDLHCTVEGRIPKDDDFVTIERKHISYFGSSSIAGEPLVFEDVAPVVFHSLREIYGIDHKTYLDSFDPEANMKEICSEGKSGNIFYFTADKQFMVKSVPKEEFDVLRSILPAYYKYLIQNRSSYLCRYFGCHSITLPVGTRKMYFVVMQNLFHQGPVHQRYDLKGNTDRRQAIPSSEVEFYMRETVQRKSIPKLMMDIDFSRIHQCMLVTEVDALTMKSQLKNDIEFLISQYIMDYSILVGVQHGNDFSSTRNGILSRDRMNLYNLGIIDMLQKYNWRWTIQRWFLGFLLCKDTSEVSAVPPNRYGQRLIHFIRHNMFNQARRESRSSLFSNQSQPGSITLSHRPSGYSQFPETNGGPIGATPATEMWLAQNLSDEIIDIQDCAILQEDYSILLFVHYPKTRLHPGPVLICILFSSCMMILLRAIMHLIAQHDDVFLKDKQGERMNILPSMVDIAQGVVEKKTKNDVSIAFWSMFYFNAATTFWYLMLAMDLISSLSNPFLPFQANHFLHHVVAWPAAGAWIGLFYWMFHSMDSATGRGVRLRMDIPMYIVLLYIVIALLMAWKKSRLLETQAHTTTRRMAKRILPYLIVFGLGGTMETIFYCIEVQPEDTLAIGSASATTNTLDQLTQLFQVVAVFVLFQRKAGICSRSRGQLRSGANSSCLTPTDDTMRITEDDGIQSLETLNVSNEMRKSIMKYTSMGIIESAQSLVPNEVSFEDYTKVETKTIIVHGKMDSGVLTFRDCAPTVFHHIRTMFQIDREEYIASFALDQILNECGSEGKSGNIFYFTANKKFMVKSVPQDEFEVLCSILPYYHTYLQAHPRSFLCRYFGCHSISLPVGSRRMYFVVMQNLFNEGPVDQRFDLKGNTDRRQAIQSHDVEQYIVRSQNRETISKLMMDIDFLKLHQAIQVEEAEEADMQSQLIEDITFLATRGIMDYSILVGVKYVQTVPMSTGGTLSKTRERLYHVGIIDMLQRYTWRWTLQRWFLGLFCCKDMGNVSAVPPNDYGARLKHFVTNRLFHMPRTKGSRCSGWTNPPSPSQSELPRPSGAGAWTTGEEFLSPSAALWRSAQSPFNMRMIPPTRASSSGGFFVVENQMEKKQLGQSSSIHSDSIEPRRLTFYTPTSETSSIDILCHFLETNQEFDFISSPFNPTNRSNQEDADIEEIKSLFWTPLSDISTRKKAKRAIFMESGEKESPRQTAHVTIMKQPPEVCSWQCDSYIAEFLMEVGLESQKEGGKLLPIDHDDGEYCLWLLTGDGNEIFEKYKLHWTVVTKDKYKLSLNVVLATGATDCPFLDERINILVNYTNSKLYNVYPLESNDILIRSLHGSQLLRAGTLSLPNSSSLSPSVSLSSFIDDNDLWLSPLSPILPELLKHPSESELFPTTDSESIEKWAKTAASLLHGLQSLPVPDTLLNRCPSCRATQSLELPMIHTKDCVLFNLLLFARGHENPFKIKGNNSNNTSTPSKEIYPIGDEIGDENVLNLSQEINHLTIDENEMHLFSL